MSTIAFEDYISEDRKQEIAETAFREICEEKFRSDAERIFSNAAYAAVWRVVDEVFDGKAAEAVAEKIPDVISGLTEFSVFRSGTFGRDKSAGQQALDAAVTANKEAINEAVRIAAQNIDRDYILDAVLDADFTLSVIRS